QPRELGVRIGDHDHDRVHALGAARLDQQRGIPDHDAFERLILVDRQDALLSHTDGRVRDLFESLPLLHVAEDDGPDALPVEAAVGREHFRTELPHDLCQRGLPRHDDLARQEIGVHDPGAEMGEHRADRALARGDPAREANQKIAFHTADQSSPALTSTLRGTLSSSADSITSTASASSVGTSSSGASKSNSSWTWSSIRLRRPRAASCRDILTIAILIRSAAVPWIGALVAMRSPKLRRFGLPLLNSGR